jgi:hypothetical protein
MVRVKEPGNCAIIMVSQFRKWGSLKYLSIKCLGVINLMINRDTGTQKNVGKSNPKPNQDKFFSNHQHTLLAI